MDHADLEKHERKVLVRRLSVSDYPAVLRVQTDVFKTIEPWTRPQFLSQLRSFPEGQLGVEVDGELVAISSSLLISGHVATSAHDFDAVTDDGFIRNHREDGDYHYGIDIAVAREYQGFKLARRLYEARKELVADKNLKGIIIGGRIPGYIDHAAEMSAEEYVERVVAREFDDPVLVAQLANGFEIARVIEGYLAEDEESCGNAVLMLWNNPDYKASLGAQNHPGEARLCVVQYQMHKVKTFKKFATQCEHFVGTASEYRSDFVVFPELLTTQLFSMLPAGKPQDAARALDQFTDPYLEMFTGFAIRYNVNIIGGSHLTIENDKLYNVAYLFRRDGTIEKQYKIHVTPSEAKWWGVTGGEKVNVFDTDRGKIAILICYDIEFPELARIAADKGANIIFTPYNTDMQSGHLRVSYCAHARAIENHVYVALAGACGNLPHTETAEIHYAQSGIYTPSDISFDREAIAAECAPNAEMVLIHDLDLDKLSHHKHFGTVHNWIDRRNDLYVINYDDGTEKLSI